MEGQNEADRFASTFQSGREAEIIVGKEDEGAAATFRLPETVFTSISAYFADALMLDYFNGDGTSVLRFPHDDVTAWNRLLHWKFNHVFYSTQEGDDIASLIHCWILGDRYSILQFQDLAMLELIKIFSGRYARMEDVKLAFEKTAQGSKLRKLMAEQLVCALKADGADPSELNLCDGVPGFSRELFEAVQFCESLAWKPVLRGGRWEEFMVGQGPQPHWILAYKDS